MSAQLQRLDDLLVDHVTGDLSPDDQPELQAALIDNQAELEAFELAAAAVDLALNPADEPMPSHLKLRLQRHAEVFFRGGSHGARVDIGKGKEGGDLIAFPAQAREDDEPALEAMPSSNLPWLVAAACFLAAVAGWWPGRAPEPEIRVVEVPTSQASASEEPASQTPVEIPTVDPATARDTWVAAAEDAGDLVRLAWSPGPTAPGEIGGGVVWSPADQKGFMRFSGLPVNDPTVEQYQLWIFDAEQDERYPVDGGVFDITSEGETVIDIDPKLAIVKATLFAITVEKPGGVVVSSRERLPVLAAVG